MLTIFFNHVRSVIIIYLSFPPLMIRKKCLFHSSQSFSHLISMSKDEQTLKVGLTHPLHPSSLLILTPALLGKHTIHGHFINLCAVILLNITQDSNVIWFHKVDGNTFAAKPTWTTNPKIQWQAITRVWCTKQNCTCIHQQLTESCISKNDLSVITHNQNSESKTE